MRVVTRDLGHRFPGQPYLFRHLDVSFEPDGVYALTGPSGSGKSTLMSLLAGWLDPTDGTVHRDGVDRVGWVFQNPHGVARRTALDHVALPLLTQGLSRVKARARAGELLDEFGLTEAAGRDFAALSGGEAQRLMLARGIAARPDLLLVDEPTAQLDTATASVVNTTLRALADRGTIVVVATHDPATRAACTTTVDLTVAADRDLAADGAPS